MFSSSCQILSFSWCGLLCFVSCSSAPQRFCWRTKCVSEKNSCLCVLGAYPRAFICRYNACQPTFRHHEANPTESALDNPTLRTDPDASPCLRFAFTRRCSGCVSCAYSKTKLSVPVVDPRKTKVCIGKKRTRRKSVTAPHTSSLHTHTLTSECETVCGGMLPLLARQRLVHRADTHASLPRYPGGFQEGRLTAVHTRAGPSCLIQRQYHANGYHVPGPTRRSAERTKSAGCRPQSQESRVPLALKAPWSRVRRPGLGHRMQATRLSVRWRVGQWPPETRLLPPKFRVPGSHDTRCLPARLPLERPTTIAAPSPPSPPSLDPVFDQLGTHRVTSHFVPNRDAVPTFWTRANNSGWHPLPSGAVVVHRQPRDKPGHL